MKLYLYMFFLIMISGSCGNGDKTATTVKDTPKETTTQPVIPPTTLTKNETTNTSFENAEEVFSYIAHLEVDFNDNIDDLKKIEGMASIDKSNRVEAVIYANKEDKPSKVSYTVKDDEVMMTFSYLYKDNKLVYVDKGHNKFILDGNTLSVWMMGDKDLKKVLPSYGDQKARSLIEEGQSVFYSLLSPDRRR